LKVMIQAPNSNPSRASKIAGIITLGWSNSPSGRAQLRRGISTLARRILRLRSRPYPVHIPKSVLVVAPHPDDETLGCGGILAQIIRAGGNVYVLFVTNGSASHPGHPVLSPEKLAALRRDEARAATSALGIESRNVSFLDASDGTLASLDLAHTSELVAKIANILTKTAAEVLLLTYQHDGSTDHEASVVLVEKALNLPRQRPQILEFPIWAWRNPLMLMKPILTSRIIWRVDISNVRDMKTAALGAYLSQTRPIPPDLTPVLSPEFTSEFTFDEEFFFEK
jgi:LmbE family N-acetylglucosaminyl deacetylase